MDHEKNILKRFYIILAGFGLFLCLIVYKLVDIQFFKDEKYKELAQRSTSRTFTIEPNRGDIYDAKLNLLATSIPHYTIRFDAVTVNDRLFQEKLPALADSLSRMLPRSRSYYINKLKKARNYGNRYLFIAEDLDFLDYKRISKFPIFREGPFSGGFIAEQELVRENPLEEKARRTVGYGIVGLEGAYNEYLNGLEGKRLKQKIANGQWKPINDRNEIEPVDGLDIVSTIDANLQDVVHRALLTQLEKYDADHGCAVVMNVKTGAIKAISNLGKSGTSGNYYEKRNYAVYESQEPGSTFKLMSLVAALEDNKVDTSDILNTGNGSYKLYDRWVRDSDSNGYGDISVAKALEVSSNVGFSKLIYQNYKDDPGRFVDRLINMGLNEKTDIQIKGEGKPRIPQPDDSDWSGTTLPWMSFGYGVSMTPLQVLSFYNAIANDGVKVKPRLIKEIRKGKTTVKDLSKTVVGSSVCSRSTAEKVQSILRKVVSSGTASNIHEEGYELAGKTGTCKVEYWRTKGNYTASFAGYFPADDPKYSCIVVVNKPDPSKGYYGSQVAAPAFKKIAKVLYTKKPKVETIRLAKRDSLLDNQYARYDNISNQYLTKMPDLTGMSAMDAIAFAKNRGLNVKLIGQGKVIKQSIKPGTKINTKYKPIVNLILS